MTENFHSADGRRYREPKLNQLMAQYGGQPHIERKQGKYLTLLIIATVALILMHIFYASLEVVPVLFMFVFAGLYLLRDEYIVEPGGTTMTLSFFDVDIIKGRHGQRPIVFVPNEKA
ncbi:hypothetical protein [Lacticaseibacillus hegangensis]|uniref:Uncharacterized protein n=1 Tax=Lacticaseibacillus hegangensis TaxID=2486010 RepID=A0ABW4CVJ6_9LACO|nr:hypothetical protein [Lacticaseibacillus hegangensis]